MLRVRRHVPRHDRAQGVVRVGRVQRPPLPLRLLPVRRGGALRGRFGIGRETGAGDGPVGRGHRVADGHRLLPAVASVRRVRLALLGVGHLAVRGGNNQESSSEAVNAWAGLALWARARGDKAMEQQATWMHSLEAQTALAYWLAPDMSAFPGFQHHIVGIGVGAKRDYATWVSPDPTASLTVQVR